MVKIKDMVMNETVSTALVVSSSSVMKTGGGKKYLRLGLTDGLQEISMMVWNWGEQVAIAVNTIVDVVGTVGEYAGKKQITYKSHEINTTLELAAFAPDAGIDVDDYLHRFGIILDNISDVSLKRLVMSCFVDYLELWKTVPAAKSIHHAYLAGTLQHSVTVAELAFDIAKRYDHLSMDLIIAGGLLHDIGKLFTYTVEGAIVVKTFEGEILDHLAIGLMILEKFKTPENHDKLVLVQHVIASHHGQIEWDAIVTPRCSEAFIVHFADNIDAKVQTLVELNDRAAKGATFTDKEWSLSNTVCIAQSKVKSIIG